MGMAVYPLQGIYKSVWATANSRTRHSIQLAKRIEGRYLADKAREKGIEDKAVMDIFDARRKGELPA